jgi:hypothetical protein
MGKTGSIYSFSSFMNSIFYELIAVTIFMPILLCSHVWVIAKFFMLQKLGFNFL